ncbi:protein turtle homolog B-like [Haliotis rufescens]|uniref:protein turtle homolog B-like n=1 Tax=Haliotis rufescens TaxID=6454 RepID=UPI00201F2F57|nr:protein turtle homolog B-like [Haliotis rufescens]
MVKIAAVSIIYAIAGVVSGAPSARPVLSAVSDTARFSWEIPQGGLGSGLSFYTVTPAGAAVFIVASTGTVVVLSNYRGRLVYQGNIAARNVTFTISNIQTSDAGTYTCGAGGATAVIQNCGQKLVVLGKPITPRHPVSTTPVYNQQVTLTCSSTSTTVPADHGLTLTYTWQRDNTDIRVTSPGSPYTFTVSSRDSHGYRCRARESQGLESECSQWYNMEPQYGPYQISLTPSASSYTVTEHQALPSITCSALCRPGCSYRWLHNGTSFSSGATLSLGQADRSKTGSYRCQPSNTHGSSDSVTVSVDVQYPATVIMFTANSLSGTLTVNESDPVTLRCQIDSNPRSVIRLLNGTEELTRADNSLTAEYRLESADCRHRGNYFSTATNNIGAPVSQQLELLIKCASRLDGTVAKQLKYASRQGGDVAVSVLVLAYPLPTFTWSRTTSTSQDLTGSSSPVSDISVTAILHLTNLQQQDFGDYSLTVDNGESSSVTYTVSIVSEGSPQIPTQFRDLDNATTSSVWLSWLPGFNGGHPQTFLLEYRQFATRTWTVYKTYADTGKMMVVEVTGLTPGDIHIFRLHARNDYVDSNRYVLVETRTTGDPPNQQKLETPCSYTGVIAGSTVGGMLLTLLIGGIVLMVLYTKGYRPRLGHVLTETALRKSTRNPETVEMDNRGYSSLDQTNGPVQYSDLEESEKQPYSQLKIYENTKADAAAVASTYEGMTETPPLTYESIKPSPYQNTGAHSQGSDHDNK